MIVYDITDTNSFNECKNYCKQAILENCKKDIKVMLVGNKADLEEDRKINKEEGEKYKEDQHLDLFMETSAKTGHNARNVLVEAAKILYKDYLAFDEKNKNDNPNPNNGKGGKKLIPKGKKEKRGCC